MFWTHLNALEPPKLPKKSKKVIFRYLKIWAGVLKVALKYFLLVFGPKNLCRHLPYLYAGKVIDLGHPKTPPIRIKCEKPLGGAQCAHPPLVIGLTMMRETGIALLFKTLLGVKQGFEDFTCQLFCTGYRGSALSNTSLHRLGGAECLWMWVRCLAWLIKT